MQNAVAAQLLGVLLALWWLQCGAALADDAPLKNDINDNPQQSDYDLAKRDWNKDLHIWGKRGWNNLHDGWGRKRSARDKRAWSNLHAGWGKRMPEDEEILRQLVAAAEQGDYDEYEEGPMIENKRNWGQFNGGWGKRSTKWDNFRGAWGKREPAWSNLKGIWGKRDFAQ